MRRCPIELAPTPIPIACILVGMSPWCPQLHTHTLSNNGNEMNQTPLFSFLPPVSVETVGASLHSMCHATMTMTMTIKHFLRSIDNNNIIPQTHSLTHSLTHTVLPNPSLRSKTRTTNQSVLSRPRAHRHLFSTKSSYLPYKASTSYVVSHR